LVQIVEKEFTLLKIFVYRLSWFVGLTLSLQHLLDLFLLGLITLLTNDEVQFLQDGKGFIPEALLVEVIVNLFNQVFMHFLLSCLQER
jgi:hypothetical protein